MTPVLIGSRAMNYWYPEAKISQNTDWDVISDTPIAGTEWHQPEFLNNAALAKTYASHAHIEVNGVMCSVMQSTGLAVIKRSHLWRDLSFQKHITHWHKFLVRDFDDQAAALLQERTALTHKAFPQGNPNLNQSVEDFFDDAVSKKYNHDWLHELYAYYDLPLYTRLQADKNKAWCSRDLWYNLEKSDQLKCIAEEAYVIATERFLVPKDWDYPAKLAYMKALNKICTTLCSGYFRDAAIDNYPSLVLMFDQPKIDKVKSTIERNENAKR